jgi:hypothetical protein
VALAALRPGHPALLAIAVALPFATGVVLRLAFAMRRAHDAAQAAALAWDRMLAQKVSERARRDEIVDRAQQALRRAEHVLAASRERLRALEREAIDADRAAAEQARAEASRLDRLGESIAAALELDRYAFLRLAAEAAGEALATPIRRLDPATAREPRSFR